MVVQVESLIRPQIMKTRLDLNFFDLESPMWACVHFTTSSAESIRERFKNRSEVKIYSFDGMANPSLMEGVRRTLEFPYFGHNWDAMNDCLRDLSWISFRSLVLVIENSSALWMKQDFEAGQLLESWLFSAESWAEQGKAFHLVFVV